MLADHSVQSRRSPAERREARRRAAASAAGAIARLSRQLAEEEAVAAALGVPDVYERLKSVAPALAELCQGRQVQAAWRLRRNVALHSATLPKPAAPLAEWRRAQHGLRLEASLQQLSVVGKQVAMDKLDARAVKDAAAVEAAAVEERVTVVKDAGAVQEAAAVEAAAVVQRASVLKDAARAEKVTAAEEAAAEEQRAYVQEVARAEMEAAAEEQTPERKDARAENLCVSGKWQIGFFPQGELAVRVAMVPPAAALSKEILPGLAPKVDGKPIAELEPAPALPVEEYVVCYGGIRWRVISTGGGFLDEADIRAAKAADQKARFWAWGLQHGTQPPRTCLLGMVRPRGKWRKP